MYFSNQTLETDTRMEGTYNHIQFKEETQTTVRKQTYAVQEKSLFSNTPFIKSSGFVAVEYNCSVVLTFLLTFISTLNHEFLKPGFSSWGIQMYLAVGTKELFNICIKYLPYSTGICWPKRDQRDKLIKSHWTMKWLTGNRARCFKRPKKAHRWAL